MSERAIYIMGYISGLTLGVCVCVCVGGGRHSEMSPAQPRKDGGFRNLCSRMITVYSME